jgi:hypothetical protein
MKSEKIKIDRDFFDKILKQVDSLSRRVEYLETLKIKVDYNDFKIMLKQANDEAMAEFIGNNPGIKIHNFNLPPPTTI